MAAPIRTARDAAKALIRPYALRGDRLEWLYGMGHHSLRDYDAHVGGYGIRADQIAVEEVHGVPCAAVFDLRELYDECVRERDTGLQQVSLFGEEAGDGRTA